MRRFLLALLLSLVTCAAAAQGPKTAGGFGTTEEELAGARKAGKQVAPAKAKPADGVKGVKGVSGLQSRNATKQVPKRGTVAPQPSIPIPANGKVITEICLTEDDLLGVIKKAAAGLASSVGGEKPSESSPKDEATGEAAFQIGFSLKDIADAVQGLRAIRFIIVRCPDDCTPEQVAADFGGKLDGSRWHRIVRDVGLFGGSAAFYMDTQDGDLMGFCYNAESKTMYAARAVGIIDLTKLMGLIKFSTK